jgi:glycosyltransferase involved in cell wall biosynthesis
MDMAAAPGRALRLLTLVLKPTGMSPGQRFRLEQWAPRLARDHGIALDFLPFESPALTQLLYQRGHLLQKAWWTAHDFSRRFGAVRRARDYDAVVVYREAALIGPSFFERLLARRRPLFFDFDDAIWLEPNSSVNGIFSYLHFWGKAATTCRVAAGVLAGNPYLADYARRQNDNVFIIPTSIELDDYPVQPEPASDDPFIVCWSGSTSTLVHFEYARPALERLAASRRVIVKIICNKPPDRPIQGAETMFVPWREETEAADVGDCHVGIMPLPDDKFARGKCGLKALQYMATGRPVIASPVGVNSDIIASGENGWLAGSDDEWVAAYRQLADSRALRAKLGAAARATVEQHYSAEVVAAQLARAIRKTLGEAAVGPSVELGRG